MPGVSDDGLEGLHHERPKIPSPRASRKCYCATRVKMPFATGAGWGGKQVEADKIYVIRLN